MNSMDELKQFGDERRNLINKLDKVELRIVLTMQELRRIQQPPTWQAMGDALGISKASAHQMCEKGYLSRRP